MRHPILLQVPVILGLLSPVAAAPAGDGSAGSHNAAGRRFIGCGRWADAAAQFELTVAQEPRNVEAHTYLCRAYLGMGRVEQAIEEGLRALAAGYTPRGQAYLAMAYVEAGNLGAAETYAQGAVRLNPNLGLGHAAEALVHMARGEREQAIASAKRGIATNDRDPDTACVLARIYESQGDTDQALYWLREALRYQPASAAAQAEMGRVLAAHGEYRAAADAYARALRFTPEDVRARGAYAEALSAAGDTEEALKQAKQALETAPGSPEGRRAMAIVLAATGECDAAIEHMESSLASSPSSADSYRRLAEMYRRVGKEFDALRAEGEACSIDGKQAEAIDRFAAAQAMRPDSAPARLRLARAYLDGGRLDEAAEAYRRILEKPDPPLDAEWDEGDALVGLGQVAYARRAMPDAIDWYKKALALDPADLAAWEGLGRVYEYQWRAISRSVVRVGVRLTSPTEPFAQDVDLPGGPVRIEGEVAWVQRGIGSGFVVNEAGDIVTNAHVVEILRPRDWAYELTVGIRRRAGTDACDYYRARVVAYDVDLDLAVVRADGSSPIPAPLPIGGSAQLSAGDWVFELGHPLGGGYGTNGGAVLSLSGAGVEYNAEFKVAMSGGPLVDERGGVVGVVCMGSPTKQGGFGRQLAVSADTLKRFLDDHGVAYVGAGSPAGRRGNAK